MTIYFGKPMPVSDKEMGKLTDLQMKQIIQNKTVAMSMRVAKSYKKARMTRVLNEMRSAKH